MGDPSTSKNIKLALFELRPNDCTLLNRLLCGLQFIEPVELSPANEADIVVVDPEHLEQRHLGASDHGSRPLIYLCTHAHQKPYPHCLTKPIRARELINCVNQIIGNLPH